MNLSRIVAASVVGVAAQGASRLLANIIVGRVAGVSALGEVGTVASAAFAASLLGPAAFGAASSKFVAFATGRDESAEAKRLEGSLQTISVIVTVALSLTVATWAAAVLGLEAALSALALTAGACLYSIARPLCFVRGQSKVGVRLELAMAVVTVVGSWLLAASGARGGLLLLPQAAAMLFYGSWFVRPQRRLGTVPGEVWEFVLLAIVGGAASAGVFQATILLSRWDGGAAEAGLATSAFSIATPLSFIASAVTSAIYPRLAHDLGAGKDAAAGSLAKAAGRLIGLVLLPWLFLLTWYSPELVTVIWGPEFLPSVALVPPVVAAIYATSHAAPEVALLTARSRAGVRLSTRSEAVGVRGRHGRRRRRPAERSARQDVGW